MKNFFDYLWGRPAKALQGLAALALGLSLVAQPPPSGPPMDLAGVLEVDPGSGAATLLFPLGTGVGRPGLRFLPALVGRFSPQVGSAPGAFALSPGSLDWPLVPGQPEIRWTYPDGTGGCAQEPGPGDLDPEEVLARFGYAPPARQDHLPHPGPAPPAPLTLAGAAGERLFALSDGPAPVPTRAGASLEAGPWTLPACLLVVRGHLACEFRLAAPGGDADTARYRLTAVRAPAVEPVRFAYGPNGLDFTAACGEAGVRVALDPDSAAPDSAGATAARLRIAYEGPGAAAPGYTVSLLVRAERLGDRQRSAATGPDALPPAFPDPLHVTRIRAEGSGETVAFTYARAPSLTLAGAPGPPGDAPTVLAEIALPARSLHLEWEPWPDALAQTGDRRCRRARWTFGVKALHEAGASTYRREAPDRVPAPSWVRQARRFSLIPGAGAAGACSEIFVRDRWTLRPGAPRAELEIPTFEWDPQEQTLVPVAGVRAPE